MDINLPFKGNGNLGFFLSNLLLQAHHRQCSMSGFLAFITHDSSCPVNSLLVVIASKNPENKGLEEFRPPVDQTTSRTSLLPSPSPRPTATRDDTDGEKPGRPGSPQRPECALQ